MSIDFELGQSTSPELQYTSGEISVIVGLYGVPGCGKTFLLNQLKHELKQEHFAFFEGSMAIANTVPSGLDAFQELEEEEKVRWREQAIDTIKKECVETGRTGVVAGHSTSWP